jgi:hypothetical protein
VAKDRGEGSPPRYDRDYLLSAEKRNQILALWEVERFGRDSFGDPDAMSLYRMRPAEWYGRGVRVLGRTAVEAARDPLARRIAATVVRTASKAPSDFAPAVVDPFAGSCNALLWLVRGLPGAVGLGFEFDDEIFRLTSRNLAAIGAPIALLQGDCRSLIGERRLPGRQPIVAPLSPPWGDALNPKTGLDLSQTKPPIAEMVDAFQRAYPETPILYVIETHEHMAHEPLARLRDKFDWSELEVFEVGGPTGRHGVLLGAQRWRGADA